MHAPSNRRIARIFFVSAVPGLLGFLVLASFTPGFWLHFSLLGMTTIAALGMAWVLDHRGSRNTKWLLSLAVLNLIVVAPETFLRLYGFRYEPGIHFAYPRSFQRLEPDEDLLWTLPKGRNGVNSLGFRGPEIGTTKAPGDYRILFLGDSVVAQGYAEPVAALLAQRHPDLTIESITLALAGYSSFQGKKLVQKYGVLCAPDLVVVSFGWNDHWLARGSVDSSKVIPISPSWPARLHDAIYSRSRLFQALRYLLISESPLPEVRVPIDDYVGNLEFIGLYFAARNVPVVFLTPPTSHDTLGVPDYLVRERFAQDNSAVVELHARYNQALRALVARHGWLLLDLKTQFQSLQDPYQVFKRDGIHLTRDGLATVGQSIADFVDEVVRPGVAK